MPPLNPQKLQPPIPHDTQITTPPILHHLPAPPSHHPKSPIAPLKAPQWPTQEIPPTKPNLPILRRLPSLQIPCNPPLRRPPSHHVHSLLLHRRLLLLCLRWLQLQRTLHAPATQPEPLDPHRLRRRMLRRRLFRWVSRPRACAADQDRYRHTANSSPSSSSSKRRWKEWTRASDRDRAQENAPDSVFPG